MTNTDWLTSTDPQAMLAWLTGDPRVRGGSNPPAVHPSARKLRLFACNCCRAVWHLLADERSRKAVETAEWFADGVGTVSDDLIPARNAAVKAWQGMQKGMDERHECTAAMMAEESCYPSAAGAAEFMVRPEVLPSQEAVVHLLRDIFNPFTPVTFDPAWRTRQVLAIAEAAYSERAGRGCPRCDFTGRIENNTVAGWQTCPHCYGAVTSGHLDNNTLSVLADALEDEGCPAEVECGVCTSSTVKVVRDAGAFWGCAFCHGTGTLPNPLLAHLRSPGIHVRGMWSLDYVLGEGVNHDNSAEPCTQPDSPPDRRSSLGDRIAEGGGLGA